MCFKYEWYWNVFGQTMRFLYQLWCLVRFFSVSLDVKSFWQLLCKRPENIITICYHYSLEMRLISWNSFDKRYRYCRSNKTCQFIQSSVIFINDHRRIFSYTIKYTIKLQLQKQDSIKIYAPLSKSHSTIATNIPFDIDNLI